MYLFSLLEKGSKNTGWQNVVKPKTLLGAYWLPQRVMDHAQMALDLKEDADSVEIKNKLTPSIPHTLPFCING